MCGRSASLKAGVSLISSVKMPMSHVVPAGEKTGSVIKLRPSRWMMAVAVPMWVMLKGASNLTMGAISPSFNGYVGRNRVWEGSWEGVGMVRVLSLDYEPRAKPRGLYARPTGSFLLIRRS